MQVCLVRSYACRPSGTAPASGRVVGPVVGRVGHNVAVRGAAGAERTGRADARRTIARSVALLRDFRIEQQDPDRFYELLSADATAMLSRRVRLPGAVVVDVGGGAGYLTRALRAAGARCVLVDADLEELWWRGAPPAGTVLADARHLPFPTASVDLVVSSNVLEHVAQPFAMVDEMARVVRPGGFVWASFTNWFGPWGGHETSPWHYLGGERARRRYEERTGKPPKNVFGESLFPLHVGQVMRRLSSHPVLEIVDARPRYLPDFARALVRVPILREVVTWNLEVLARRRHGPVPRPTRR